MLQKININRALVLLFCFLNVLKCSSDINWGTPLNGIAGNNVNTECKFHGEPICCSSLKNTNKKPVDLSPHDLHLVKNKGKCVTTREYVPSLYEIRHLLKSKELAKTEDIDARQKQLTEFMGSTAEVQAAVSWLARVKVHMEENSRSTDGKHHDGSTSVNNKDDFEYLSYFNMTRHCEGRINSSTSWIEWIEPLTVHARHPFALLHVDEKLRDAVGKSKVAFTKAKCLLDLDYIILKSGEHMTNYEKSEDDHIVRNNAYMLDAGTSRFDSSLWWFTCAYSQTSIEFDSLFGWEMTLLEPNDFWKHVPPKYENSYHFFNKPITAGNDSNNPLHVALNLGVKESDFVAFKLDIDTPYVEIPIALSLLQNPEFYTIIDEFFFELHFRCEILRSCCWREPTPHKFGEYVMDRAGALEFFSDLRKRGIRAHFWP
eukprot:gene13430-28479_t